jgi:hypothetical protein
VLKLPRPAAAHYAVEAIDPAILYLHLQRSRTEMALP